MNAEQLKALLTQVKNDDTSVQFESHWLQDRYP